MSTENTSPTAEELVTPSPSEREINLAATNNPALAPDEFTLGDRKFKVMNLRYDDYICFLGYLRPFLEGIGKSLVSNRGVQVPDITINSSMLDAGALFTFCINDLPDMVRIVCKQTDKTVTVEDVKDWAGEPFILCEIVLRQVARNNMIGQFASFFAHLLPILTRMGLTQKMATESKISATQSS